jgi:hypothetical protein
MSALFWPTFEIFWALVLFIFFLAFWAGERVSALGIGLPLKSRVALGEVMSNSTRSVAELCSSVKSSIICSG